MKLTHDIKNHSDFIHQKATELLHFLDNTSPNRVQLQVVKQLIRCWVIPIHMGFKDCLTAREQSCLWYAAKGLSVDETAHVMKIRPTTVKKHRSNILNKLHVRSLLEAIIKSGLIMTTEYTIDVTMPSI